MASQGRKNTVFIDFYRFVGAVWTKKSLFPRRNYNRKKTSFFTTFHEKSDFFDDFWPIFGHRGYQKQRGNSTNFDEFL
jgi:phospholipase C